MAPRVRTSETGSLPDRRDQHERETAELRMRMAAIVKIVFTLLATVLALAALLVVAGSYVSAENSLVRLVLDAANAIDGPFSADDGVFVFTGDNAEKLDAVVNWGLGAVVYMLIGNLLRAVMRPRAARRL